MNLDHLNNKQQALLKETQVLYQNPPRKHARWIWNKHVQVVAKYALVLARKYKADEDYVFAGALLHDLADVWYERADSRFEVKSNSEAERILKKAGFKTSEITVIIDEVIKPHSCHPGNFPQTLEGKSLATADSLAHLNTNLYPSMKRMGLPKYIEPKGFNQWVSKKLDRDFHSKIFFEDERESARKNYEKLKKLFT